MRHTASTGLGQHFALACAVLLAGCSVELDTGPAGPRHVTPEPTCTTTDSPGAPVPMRRLTRGQVQRSAVDVLGLSASGGVAVPDETLYTYRSNVASSIDVTSARAYLDFAEASAAAADMTRCTRAECAAWLLDEVGPRLFRRALDPIQRARYETLFLEGAAEGDVTEGARWVIEAMLQSPSFLYLDEVVREDGYLDDHSMAARLALALWGQNPDLALLAEADAGRLSSPEEVRAAAERLLADTRSEGGLGDFVDQWLHLERLDDPAARPDLASLGADVVSALRAEPALLFRMLALEGGSGADLLTSSESVRLAQLDALYGTDLLSSSAERSSLDPTRRAGILSLPGVQAALAHADSTSPTLRGFAVLSSFLCTPPPPPPAGVSVTLPPPMPGATTRERLELHFSDESCAACHRSMDSIGFAFESFDWLGRSRDEEGGRPIDDTGTFLLGGREVSVDGPVELGVAMAETQAVSACVARQWTRYATGVPESAAADCLVQRMASSLGEEDGVRSMILELISSDWFRRGREMR